MARHTYQYVKDFIEKNTKSQLLSSEYCTVSTKMMLRCDCGDEFLTTFNDVRRGKVQCNKCSLKQKYLKKSKTHESFISEVNELTGEEYEVIGIYKNSKTKIKIKHKNCGTFWSVKPNSFLSGSRCPNCFRPNYNMDTPLYKKRVFDLVGCEYDVIGEYIKSTKKIEMLHNTCGLSYDVTPSNFLFGQRCPKCNGSIKKTQTEFETEIFDLVGSEYSVLGEYINTKTHIKVRHNICGFEYDVTPSNILKGRRCPQCNESKGEAALRYYCENEKIPFAQEYSFDELMGNKGVCLRFDMAILKLNGNVKGLIEYDGVFHYEVQYSEENFNNLKIHDERKNQYCKNNDIPLLRIPYWEFDNIESVLDEWLISLK